MTDTLYCDKGLVKGEVWIHGFKNSWNFIIRMLTVVLEGFGGARTGISVKFQVSELLPRMLAPSPIGFHVCFL